MSFCWLDFTMDFCFGVEPVLIFHFFRVLMWPGGGLGKKGKSFPSTAFCIFLLASNSLEVKLRLFPAFPLPSLVPNSHSLLLPHPPYSQKKAKVLTICLWLGKNVCSTRGNFSGPNELKILMSWENLGWGGGTEKQTRWMSVVYCVAGKCLQNVLILVKEVRETCYHAFPTLLSWPESSKKIWICCIYPGPSQPVHKPWTKRAEKGFKSQKGISLGLVTDPLWTSFVAGGGGGRWVLFMVDERAQRSDRAGNQCHHSWAETK